MVLVVSGVLGIGAALSGCGREGSAIGDGPGQAVGGPGGALPSGPDGSVLEAWRDFPAGRHPRPIVLMGSRIQDAGYTTGQAKMAAVAGAYHLVTRLPDPPPATVPVTLPDGTVRLPTIDAASALDLLRGRGGSSGVVRPKITPSAPLAITDIEYGTASFLTDRGPRTLPAWLFHTADEIGPTAVLALAPEAVWPLDGAARPVPIALSLTHATVSADGLTLTVTLAAAPEPCPGQPIVRYAGVAVESSTAVAVGLTGTVTGTRSPVPGRPCAQALVYRTAAYRIHLAAPLGGRVLLDSAGKIIPVTSA